MTIDCKLLRRAWPEGYLAVRGVATVGGFQCTKVRQWGVVFDDPNEYHGGIVIRGDIAYAGREQNYRPDLATYDQLLPNVDPADIATWACLLADLAEASKLGAGGSLGFRWVRVGDGEWMVQTGLDGGTGVYGYEANSRRFRVGTDDPALALVLARIQLREASCA